MQSVYIFKVDTQIKKDDIEKIPEDIRQQIADGLVVLNGNVKFCECVTMPEKKEHESIR